MRHRWVLLFVGVVAAGALGSAFFAPGGAPGDADPSVDRRFEPDGVESGIWPYTSRSRSVEARTLALNVVILGSPAEVREALADRSDREWEPADGDRAVDDTGSIAVWRPARGAARYTYVWRAADGGAWVESAYQLATGTYLGARSHVRAYPSPSGEWTALQAHTEYWDWYRLRHTVTGVDAGSQAVERDLRDEPFVGEVRRVYHGHEGGGSDGWMTVIELDTGRAGTSAPESAPAPAGIGSAVAVLLVLGSVSVANRGEARDAVLPATLIGLVLGVRALGIAAEGLFPATSPKAFAAVLYPILAFGPPILVAALARDRPPVRTALLAAAGLGAGFVLDFGSVGVSVVPVRLVLHRTALLGALGLCALAVARSDRRALAAGLLAWTGLLAASLLGVV